MKITVYNIRIVLEQKLEGDKVQSSPVVSGGYVYVRSDDKKIYCLNVKTGAKVWQYETEGLIYSSPTVSGDKVYVGSTDNKVYCLNAAIGDTGS